jgi:hypothetical protein
LQKLTDAREGAVRGMTNDIGSIDEQRFTLKKAIQKFIREHKPREDVRKRINAVVGLGKSHAICEVINEERYDLPCPTILVTATNDLCRELLKKIPKAEWLPARTVPEGCIISEEFKLNSHGSCKETCPMYGKCGHMKGMMKLEEISKERDSKQTPVMVMTNHTFYNNLPVINKIFKAKVVFDENPENIQSVVLPWGFNTELKNDDKVIKVTEIKKMVSKKLKTFGETTTEVADMIRSGEMNPAQEEMARIVLDADSMLSCGSDKVVIGKSKKGIAIESIRGLDGIKSWHQVLVLSAGVSETDQEYSSVTTLKVPVLRKISYLPTSAGKQAVGNPHIVEKLRKKLYSRMTMKSEEVGMVMPKCARGVSEFITGGLCAKLNCWNSKGSNALMNLPVGIVFTLPKMRPEDLKNKGILAGLVDEDATLDASFQRDGQHSRLVYKDTKLDAYWQLKVYNELMQEVGRFRPYTTKGEVFIISEWCPALASDFSITYISAKIGVDKKIADIYVGTAEKAIESEKDISHSVPRNIANSMLDRAGLLPEVVKIPQVEMSASVIYDRVNSKPKVAKKDDAICDITFDIAIIPGVNDDRDEVPEWVKKNLYFG